MKVKWIGETREVYKHGVFSAGDIIDLPEDIAADLIRQGFCEEVTPPAPSRKTKGA